jgi:succinate dehydrogenase hydrophobic anchor subunit
MERALPLIALNISFSLMLSGLTLFTAKKWYYKCWITSLELNSNLKIRNTMNINMLAFENNSILNRMDEMIIKREFLLFFREPTQWLHLAVMIFLMIIFMSGISGIRIIIDDSYYNDLLRTIIYLVVSLFGIFMVAALSLRFIFPLVSLEGETVWKIRSAPVNHKSFLIKRLLIYFAFVFITGQLITFFANHQFPLRLSVIGQINSIFITISIASINFGMGGYFANYKERNPIRLSSSQGASITFLFILAYMVLLIALLFIPVYKFFESEHFSVNAPLGNLAITTAVLFISSIIISFFSIRAGLNSFLRDY